jgi:hypothetical protein
MTSNNKNKSIYCNNIHCYNKENDEIYEKDFQNTCPGFDIYPTIISHKERIIAIGDIHGDMNLAINFLKAGKVIEEISNPIIKFDTKIKEYIQRLIIKKNNSLELDKKEFIRKTYMDISNTNKEYDIVYLYYKINDIYYVKVKQEDNNPNILNCNLNCDYTRWFKWIGGKTHVVQVGDQIDRCRPFDKDCSIQSSSINDENSDIEIMLLYDSLDQIAKKEGGRVFSLLGNHEIMNIDGDTRYVSYKGIKEFSPEPQNYEKGLPIHKSVYRNIISKKMVCTRSTVLVIGDYLFVHGGITSKLAYEYNLIDINSIIRKYLHTTLETNKDLKSLLNSSKYSPLWYRKLAYIPEDNKISNNDEHHDCLNILDPILSNINKKMKSSISTDAIIEIKGLVIGHTPQFSIFNQGITTACSNRIVRTDIGGSTAFNNFATNLTNKKARQPQVIEILRDETGHHTLSVLFFS